MRLGALRFLLLALLALALPQSLAGQDKEFNGWTVGGQGGIPFAGFTLPAQSSDPGCFAFPTPTSTNCSGIQIEQTTNIFVQHRGLVVVPGTVRNIPKISAGGGKLDFSVPTCSASVNCTGNAELSLANSDGVAVSSGGRSKGFLGGGQLGYNHQFVKLVLGSELEFSGSTVNGTAQAIMFLPPTAVTNCVNGSSPGAPCTATIATFTRKASSTWTGSLRARAGWVAGHTLIYATGGPAITSVTVNAVDTFTTTLSNGDPSNGNPGSAQASSGVVGYTVFSTSQDTHIQLGWTAGAGFERALWKRFRWGAEYRHLSAGNKTFPGTAPLSVTVNPGTATVTGAGSSTTCCVIQGPSDTHGGFLAGGVIAAPLKINYSDDRIVGRFSIKLW